MSGTFPLMTTDMKRVTILLPEEEFERLQEIARKRHESVSNIGRRLLIEWMEKEYPRKPGNPHK